MLVKGTLVSQMSGSLAGITASRNRGGQYFRERAIPTDPNTTFQQALRGYMAQLANVWVNVLTQAQRDAWETYAENVTVPNPLGDQIQLSGINHYIRSNTPRLQAGLARVDAGPTIFNLGDFTNPSFTAAAATTDFAVTFETGDDWVGEDDAGMLMWSSRQQNPTINFFRGPYRFADSIDGDAVTPPTSPATIVSPFALTAGNVVFGMFRVSRADGRLSQPFRAAATVA